MPELAELPRMTAEGHLLLHDVDWETYEAFLARFEDSRIFLTYDEGTLEIMAPSLRHDKNKTLIGSLIETMAAELNIDIDGCGSATVRRKSKSGGLEPDESYYVGNTEKVWNIDDELDFEKYPVPDLVVETEVTKPLVKRLPVFAKLGFPEIWRYSRKTRKIEFLHLMASGKYEAHDKSKAFPFLSSADFQRFLDMSGKAKLNQIIREYQQWVRQFKK